MNLCQGAAQSGILAPAPAPALALASALALEPDKCRIWGADGKALLQGDSVINNGAECHFNWRSGTSQMTAGGKH